MVRTRDPVAKRAALAAAGLALAQEEGLAEMSVHRITARAGVAKGSFFHHFGDRAAFLAELHRTFHDRLVSCINAVVDGLRPGRERLVAGSRAYLDGCRADRATRALLVQARTEPAIQAAIAARNEQFAALAAADFAAIGRAHPMQCARLWVVMAAEIAVAESNADRLLPSRRAALFGYLEATS